ncbi:hypothetical protein [Kitasatospora sp. NPDC050463]|uniref:hypothetical protein n=1 Tax=Kitasatospora sp. NPDC050463 TaxID=3155786 RepID=UPI00340CFADE
MADAPREVSVDLEHEIMSRFAVAEAEEVREQILQAVQEELGTSPNIEVEPLVIRRGHSIEILVILTTLGTFLGTYNDLVKQITKAVEQTRRIVSAIVERLNDRAPRHPAASMEVTASWRMGAAGERFIESGAPAEPELASTAPVRRTRENLVNLALIYVVVVNTVLMAAVGYLLGRV